MLLSLYKHTLFIGFLSLSTACVSHYKVDRQRSYSKTYNATYDEVWRSLQQSIMAYPLRINNMDNGEIQTTVIKSTNMFIPPGGNNKTSKSGGHRYQLAFNVVKIGKKRTKIIINKNLELVRDFISKPQKLISDALEETVILYRVKREIVIERKLLKVSTPKG